MMLPWMLGESWSRRESLKDLRCGGVGEVGLIYFLDVISDFIVVLIFPRTSSGNSSSLYICFDSIFFGY